ncbi:acyl-[ACP]--phospholipid O-acyltransferase [Planctomycetota bacterium]
MSVSKMKLSESFAWLNVTQFLGALNDNIFKLLLVAFIVGDQGSASASTVSALSGAIFVVPFLLFLALAGTFADRFSKRNIVVAVKFAEVIVMALGFVAFILEAPSVLYFVLFLMAAQSAFFSPSKYGIIPELVNKEQLSRANSFLEALTYLAIVIGAVFVPVLLWAANKHYPIAGLVCVSIAVVGLLASLQVGPTEASGVKKRASFFFLKDIWRTLWSIHRKRDLLLAVLAAAYFMLIGAFIQFNVIPYSIERLGFDETQGGYLFLPGAIGIGVGAFLAGRLSGRHIELGLVPLGALGLTVFSAALGLVSGPLFWPLLFIFLIGLSAGLYIVPIHAFIQLRSPRVRRGQILAASSFVGWVGVLLASGLLYFFSDILGLTAAQIFIVLGLMTLALTIATVKLLPDFLVRFICLLLTRLCYRIKVSGIENIPAEGPVLLVCNHVSYVDALLLNATQQRRIRFVMDRDFYNIKWLKPICKLMRAIPISSQDPPKRIVSSLRQARAAMDDGYIVCVFAEGTLTRTGMLHGFKSGFERIMKASSYSIIPAYIGGAWGSIFSHYYGKPLSTLPKKFPYPVGIHFGEPMPAGSTADQIRQKVMELSCDYFGSLKPGRRSVGEHFVQVARKNWRSRCISDSTGRCLNYGQTLVSTIALSSELAKIARGQDKVGILLPPSVGGALANLAVTMAGKVSVNLNYTVSEQIRDSAIEQCSLKCIISSHVFVQKLPNLKNLNGVVFLEDIVTKINSRSKLKAYLKARFIPRRFLANARRFHADDLATIIFSSGSSGQPKGVMLSHHNILSNIEAVRTVFRLRADDNLCGVLPFFHSFGYTCALWLPVVTGVSSSFVANPIDGVMVGRTARENHSTILFAAPTFLLNYIRRLLPEDFASFRSVVVGAEKLKKRVADSFEAKFGVRPLEGYGTTELSPVVSLNLPDVESGEMQQIGRKEGTIGHPIPGVAVKIADIESSETLPLGEEGLLMVKGPNVMLGYLNMPQKTTEVIKDGWYNTGDIARMDENGFLTITDRLSRFSKIAGEMVPHLGVEEVYHKGLDTDEQVVAVTSVPHIKKGEELVVLYVDKAGDPDKLHEIVSHSDLPNIWKPRRDNYIRIKEIPSLGSGKLDIVKLRKIASDVKSTQLSK